MEERATRQGRLPWAPACRRRRKGVAWVPPCTPQATACFPWDLLVLVRKLLLRRNCVSLRLRVAGQLDNQGLANARRRVTTTVACPDLGALAEEVQHHLGHVLAAL